ncbi:hypothetical protein PHYBOEH_003445 [Phytophthora boehmeriae]|uniref:Protein kinase domain-containing protein n=1 Tax=Phytophthora boehmeriae TaxID=109152 RepID=A0A8T1WTI8_9STRA|nr:hypothetical protein PHYBOEH_003445 [Phytophthora boehmeriae]
MGAAIMKTCFVGEPTDAPAPRQEARRLYQQLNSRSAAKMAPPRAHEKEVTLQKRRALELKQTAVRLQQLSPATVKQLQASSVSSETATMSESSFVADSPASPARFMSRSPSGHNSGHNSGLGFRTLLPAQYVLECVAGKGTTSTCYKCRRKTDGKRFACKIIEKRRLAPSARKRVEVAAQLRREVDVLKRLQHPHIAKLEQAFEDENYLILIMELMEGGELFDAIVNKGKFSEREATHVARCILSAIQHMHERGVVHRDLKPENMLLAVSTRRADGRRRHQDVANALDVKIIDFGFAKVLSEGGTSTSFLGTGGYLAPEVLLRKPYATAVDMWSFGVLAYLLLCGRLPFAATTQLRPNQKIQSLYKLTFPKRYWQGVSPMAIDFLQRVLVLNPSARMTAAEALNHPWLRC